jgi:hypothetical protein
MEGTENLKEGGWAPDAFPPSGDDVEFGADEVGDQLGQLDAVEKQISELATPGLTASLAKGQAEQLCEAVKGVDLKETAKLSEEQFGRKLYKNVKSMFRFVLGGVMRAIVENNYPVDRFISRENEVISVLYHQLQELEAEEVTSDMPDKPDRGDYEVEKRVKWAEKLKQKGKVRRSRKKADKGESWVDTAGEPSPMSEGEDDQEREACYLDIDKKYFNDLEAYKAECLKVKKKKALTAQYTKETAKVIVLNTIVEGLRTAMGLIISKIKAAVKDHDKVKQKLMSMVVLKSTGVPIPNPLENNNLAGLYEILKLEYAEATLIRFNADLQSTMKLGISVEDLHKNPTKAVQLTDEALEMWMSMDYWRYMTPDIFFTNILLMSLPASSFQVECVKEVQKYQERRENGEVRDDGTVASTGVKQGYPTYNHLRAYIKRCEESARHNKSVSQTANRRPPPYGVKFGNVETAALSGAEYTTEIGRDKQIKCKDVHSGHEHPYTATKEVCRTCHGKTPSTAGEKHLPRCFQGSCSVCHLFGHKAVNCGQAPSTYVTPKSTTASGSS